MADQIRAWAQAQWGEVELGDARRTRRAVDIGAAMAANAGLSLPRQMTNWAELKAAYRLFDRPQASHAALTAPHRQATRRAAEAESGVVLFAQDTTELDFTTHPTTEGLGAIGNGKQRGFLVHSCLAMRPDPSARPVLGLAEQQVWVRTQSGLRHQPRRQRLARSKQSDVWSNSLAAIGPAPDGAVWVSVGDRESDIFDHLFRARELGWHALVRARHDRTLDEPLGPGLLTKIRAQPAQASRSVMLSRRAGGVPSRPQRLSVAWLAVSVPAPWCARAAAPLDLWCVRAWGGDVEWILLTTLAVTDARSALDRLDWYSCRWTMEEYHKGLKSGCAMERLRLRSADRLKAALGFVALIAVRLLQLRSAARQDPSAPALQMVDEPLVHVLARRLKVDAERMSVHEFWRGVARLGGFLGRKCDGDPGWQSLWHGMHRLLDLAWAEAPTHVQSG